MTPVPGLDVERLRRETPGCGELLHFDNAGAALVPNAVARAVEDHLARERRLGGYAAEEAVGEALEAVYASLARLLNADPAEIALMENATRAWDMAFYALDFAPGDVILTTTAEYASNVLAFLQMRRRRGVDIEVLADEASGEVDVAALSSRLGDPRVRLVAVSHAPAQSGLVQPAAAIGALTRAAGVPFLLDACQSVGQLPVDVQAIGCDMLTGTSRKFLRGPRGVGFLYIRRTWIERLDPPFVDLRAATWTSPDTYVLQPDARRFESWECAVASRLGFGAAVDYALALGLEAIAARIARLSARLREGLATLPGVTLRDGPLPRSGIVAFTREGEGAPELQRRLRAAHITTTSVSAPTARFDFEARGLEAVLRASPHVYNTEAEVDRFVDAVAGGPP